MTNLVVHVDIAGVPVRAGIAYFTIGRAHVSTRNQIAPSEQDRFEAVLGDRLAALRDLVT